MSPIASYLDELGRLLRFSTRRRRIIAEVRTHLLDAAAAARQPGEQAEVAQRRAVERFGSPPDVARAFNAIHRRRRALVRRSAAVALTCAATASVGTATVWALEPGASSQAHAAVHATNPGHHHRARGRANAEATP